MGATSSPATPARESGSATPSDTVTIRGNAIYGNGGLGIKIGKSHRPAPQRRRRLDGGPNQQQNFPIVRLAPAFDPQTVSRPTWSGKLHSTPSTTFDLDFYANPACSNFPREFSKAETWLGTAQVTTDATAYAAST